MDWSQCDIFILRYFLTVFSREIFSWNMTQKENTTKFAILRTKTEEIDILTFDFFFFSTQQQNFER